MVVVFKEGELSSVGGLIIIGWGVEEFIIGELQKVRKIILIIFLRRVIGNLLLNSMGFWSK